LFCFLCYLFFIIFYVFLTLIIYLHLFFPQLTLDSSFDKGDNIAAWSSADGSTFWSIDTGYFSVPAADFNGKCNDFNYAGFQNDIDSRSCQRELFSKSAGAGSTDDPFKFQCQKDFSVSRYVQNLYIAKIANLRATTANPAAASLLQVTLNSLTYKNFYNDAVSDVKTTFTNNNCASTWYANKATHTSSSCYFGSATTASVADIPHCQNMVTSVKYTIEHAADAAGTITVVKADVVITDVPQDRSKNTIITQTYSADFVSAFGGSVSEGYGNQAARAKSGNPGYIMGKPVVIGGLVAASGSTLATIGMSTDGLQVSSPMLPYDSTNPNNFGSGKCPNAANVKGWQTVGFGYDMVTGCQLELSRQALKNLCCTGSSDCTPDQATTYADTTSGIPHFLSLPTADQYVGQYGNADPLDVSQWLKMSVRATTANSNWNANTGVCKNMKSGLHYKFLVASSGEKGFPQSKIVAAEVEQVVSDWYSNVPNDDTVSTQTFPLTVTVSFIHKDSTDLEGYVPPAPPVLFKVPHDVFYPFFMSPAAPRPTISMLSIFAPLVATFMLFWLQL
jgi:tectonic-1/3